MKFAAMLLVLSAGAGWQAFAQTPVWDSSGNGLLKGTYYFREVFYSVGDNFGDLSEASALYGSITFNGSGAYTCAVTFVDTSRGIENGTLSGTYSIAASGYGFLSSPLYTGDYVYGLVNQSGIFVGSTTETVNGFNDLFVAAPLASPVPTAASFKGSYWVAGIDLSSGSPLNTINSLFQLNPDGAGNLGDVSVSAYLGGGGSTKYSQSVTGGKYIASSGAMVVTFPTSSTALISGQKYIYISPDGNFIFGGSPTGYDMFVGVRAASGAASLSGLYYQAGIDQDVSQLANGFANLDTFYGSLSAGGGAIIAHERLFSPFDANAIDYTSRDVYPVSSTGTYSTPLANFVVGAGGVRIGSGVEPFLGISVALPAPGFSGSGVYLNPTGIVNAASSAPFTAGIAPGELLTIYGTGLADSPAVAPGTPFPNTLGNVQVMINGVAAPIYYVTPTQISAIVPYSLNSGIAQVQVITDGNPSNTITMFTNLTSPGVFSAAQNGLGVGAVLHQDGSLVSPANPAQINETVSVFATGLGAVTPGIADGAAGPTDPLSKTSNTIAVYIGGTQTTVTYSGLAPQLAGLYQLNVTVPSGLTSGDNPLDISGPDGYTSEVLISIAGTTTANFTGVHATPRIAKPAAPLPKRRPRRSPVSYTPQNRAR